jgi:uncharacterized protein (DUF1501 family)
MRRRELLRGSLGWIGATLALGASGSARASTSRRACILVYLHGGASQFETFDPKPGTTTGGPTRAIATRVDGLRFADTLPRLAARADRLAVVRSLTAKEGNHDRARYLMRTGQPPQGGAVHPGLGALVSEAHPDLDVPPVAIGVPGQGPGLLGPRHAALFVRDADRPLRNVDAPVDAGRASDRAEIWRALQSDFAEGRTARAIAGHTDVVERATALMASPRLAAFALARESEATRARYGDDAFGRGCLLARRLVDAGVAFVEVGLPGWDTHEDGFARAGVLATTLDRGLAALLDDLVANGRLADTLVVCVGDFGRTPAINARGGRGHFPRCSSLLLAGGGIRGGTVVGATSADGTAIAEREVTVPDLFRTLAHALELDADRVRMAPSGRPITTVDGGAVIDELV